tara:strand:- start:14605 stop:15294 length:690 start_codon:yes stop_codon:yes gene_type:complete
MDLPKGKLIFTRRGMPDMYILYAFSTPNSLRVAIALEELGLEYKIVPINVRTGEQKTEAHLVRNPNGKVPVLVDPDSVTGEPFTLTESGAILLYLAEKTGKLLPENTQERARVYEQVFFHLTGIGPAFGQLGYFKRQASAEMPVAINRFQIEADRVLAVFDRTLASRVFAAGREFTLADITHFSWLWRREFAGIGFDHIPNVERWYRQIESRPAVLRAIDKLGALVPDQ